MVVSVQLTCWHCGKTYYTGCIQTRFHSSYLCEDCDPTARTKQSEEDLFYLIKEKQ